MKKILKATPFVLLQIVPFILVGMYVPYYRELYHTHPQIQFEILESFPFVLNFGWYLFQLLYGWRYEVDRKKEKGIVVASIIGVDLLLLCFADTVKAFWFTIGIVLLYALSDQLTDKQKTTLVIVAIFVLGMVRVAYSLW